MAQVIALTAPAALALFGVSFHEPFGRAGAGLVLLAQPAIYGLIALFPTRTSRPVAWTLAAAALAATAVLIGIVLATTEDTPTGGPGNCLAACPLSLRAA